jgi:hypothetical protein
LAGNYLKSLQLAKQLEERAKEASKNRELAEKENESLQQFLKTCSDNDVDLTEVEKPQKDFEAAVLAKDYQTAIAHIRKAREVAKEAYIKRIGDVADSVDAILALIQGSGGEAKGAGDYLERSKERVVADDLEGAMKFAKNAYDAAERQLHEFFSQLFSQAQDVLMQAKEMGDDVAIFEDQLLRAKSALENQEYEACATQLKEVLDGAGEDLKTTVNSTISRAEEVVSAGEELGADMARVKNHVERSRTALSSLKFKEALSYAKKAETEGEGAISTRFQELARDVRESIKKMKNAKEDVAFPQQLLDQAMNALKDKKYIEALHALNTAHEKVHQAEFDSVLLVISQARDRFVLAKKVGVDMTKAIMLLNTSRDNLKLGKFEDAIRYAEQSRKEVDTSLEMFYSARDQVVELAKAVKFAADLGGDPTAIKNILADARKFFEEKEYDKTAEATKLGLAEVKKIANEKAMVHIDTADKAVKLGKEIGADMTEAEGTLQRALETMSKENMLESVTLARSSKEAADAAMTRVMSDRLQSLDQFIKGYSGDAESVSDLNEIITQSRQNVASFEFDKAYKQLKQVTEKLESIGKSECEKSIAAAVEKIEAVKAMDGDASDLEILLTRANDALNRKVYEDVTARAREIVQHADDAMAKIIQAELSSVKDTLEEARTIGINTEESKQALREVRTHTESGAYQNAFNIVKNTKDSLRSKIGRYDGIKNKFTRAEDLIAEATKTKADAASLARRLEEARTAFTRIDLDRTDEILDKLIQEGEKSLAMYLAAKFILSSKETIDLAQSHGIDVKEPAGMLAASKDLMKQKRYEEALASAKACDKSARNAVSSSISDMIRGVQRLLADARNVGVDTFGPEKLLQKATELAGSADYVEALKCISSAREDINHVKNLSSQAAVEIRVARGNLKDAETLDIEVGRSRELLEQAIEALTRHQYAIALELARKSSETSSEISRTRIWGTLQKFKERIDKAASEGLNIGMADRCVAEGIQSFKSGKYQDSLKLAMKCEAEMDRAELQRDISSRAVDLARMKLADATVEGIRSQELADLVARADKLLKEGKYVDAMAVAIESGDELHSIKDNLDMCRISLSAARERIERLKKVEIDTSDIDEVMAQAQERIGSQDFDGCKVTLERAASMATELFETSIKDVMDQNRQMITKAKSMGINTKPCDDLLEVANTSFSEKLWDFAYQQAMSCRESCISLISKKITDLVSEVKSRVDDLRRYGASVKVVENLIGSANKAASRGDIAGAFEALMEADSKITSLEESHEKYLDIMIAAESAMENLARFGLSKREPERLLDMAEIEKDKDYDSAIELVAAALDTAKEMMEAYSPDLAMSIASPGLQENSDSELTLTVRNTGKALAKDVNIEVLGDFEVKEAKPISTLKPNTESPVAIRLIPRKSGSVPVRIKLTSKRQFDGKLQTFELEDSVNVFSAGPPYRIGRAADMNRCISCQGRIKPGFDIMICRCGGQLHLSCAKRANQCPVCGQKYEF